VSDDRCKAPLDLDLTRQEPIPEAGVQAALALMRSGKLHRDGEVGSKPRRAPGAGGRDR
jgi:hypothetical protein